MNEWLLAAENGNVPKLRTLIYNGVNLDERDKYGRNALHIVARGNFARYMDCTRLLVNARADVNAKTKGGYTPLIFAVDSGSSEQVLILLENGAEVNLLCGPRKESALTRAVVHNYFEVVDTLLQHKADVNVSFEDGATVLQVAVYHRSKTCVELLIDYGAKYTNATEYMTLILEKRQRCRAAAKMVYALYYFHLKIPRDLVRMLARIVWDSRYHPRWTK